jgi:hypothetical protein
LFSQIQEGKPQMQISFVPKGFIWVPYYALRTFSET